MMWDFGPWGSTSRPRHAKTVDQGDIRCTQTNASTAKTMTRRQWFWQLEFWKQHFLSTLCLYYSLCLYWFCWQFQAFKSCQLSLKFPTHRKVSKSLCEGNSNMKVIVNLLSFIHFSLTKGYSVGWKRWKNGLNHMLTSSRRKKRT